MIDRGFPIDRKCYERPPFPRPKRKGEPVPVEPVRARRQAKSELVVQGV